ncbi:unnamed protein product, partial [Heterosigma akashiwo]
MSDSDGDQRGSRNGDDYEKDAGGRSRSASAAAAGRR